MNFSVKLSDIPEITEVNIEGKVFNIGHFYDISPLIPPSLDSGLLFSFAGLQGEEVLDTHVHDNFSIIFILSGTADLLPYSQKNKRVQKGDIILIPPYVNHGFSNSENFLTFTLQLQKLQFFDTDKKKSDSVEFLTRDSLKEYLSPLSKISNIDFISSPKEYKCDAHKIYTIIGSSTLNGDDLNIKENSFHRFSSESEKQFKVDPTDICFIIEENIAE